MPHRKYLRPKMAAGGAIAFFSGLCSITAASAIQLANGTVYFDKVPRLQGAATTVSNTQSSGATYYFELDIPEEAGEPLKQIQIQQKEGVDRVKFNLERTRAYLNKRRGVEIEVETVEIDDANRITVSFVDAIAPGKKVVLGMRPRWNPDTAGVYLFGVTALPEGEMVHPQFLGYGRLHFYERNGFHSKRFGRYRGLTW